MRNYNRNKKGKKLKEKERIKKKKGEITTERRKERS
jgi:hypothetical protein